MNVFDFVNSININKEDLIRNDPNCEKEYLPYIINTQFSYFQDTVFFAAEMAKYPHLSKQQQFDFYRLAIPKKKRYSKWAKQEKPDSDVELIQKVYNVNRRRAQEMFSIYTKEALNDLRKQYSNGGK